MPLAGRLTGPVPAPSRTSMPVAPVVVVAVCAPPCGGSASEPSQPVTAARLAVITRSAVVRDRTAEA